MKYLVSILFLVLCVFGWSCFYVGSGHQTLVLMLSKQALYWLTDFQLLQDLGIYECSVCTSAGQKRAPDPIIDGHEPPCGCWELDSGPLGTVALTTLLTMLLTTELSLQLPTPQAHFIKLLLPFLLSFISYLCD